MNLEEASQCRSCVGILLYLATDLPHCQHVMRWLSTGTATPASRKKDVLRHLVSYLRGTKGFACVCTIKVIMLEYIISTSSFAS